MAKYYGYIPCVKIDVIIQEVWSVYAVEKDV